jgi:transposase
MEQPSDAGPARGRRDRVALAGGRTLACPAARLPALADGLRLVPALARPWPVRGSAAGRGAPSPSQGWPPTGAEPGHHRHADGEVHRRARPAGVRRGQGRGRAQAGRPGRRRGALARGRRRADTGKARWPTLREGVYDGAFAAERCCAWSNLHGMRHRVVARDPAARGFVALARRWVVERSFGWLSHWSGLAKDRAGRLDVSAARLACACVLSGFEALLNPMPIRAHAR